MRDIVPHFILQIFIIVRNIIRKILKESEINDLLHDDLLENLTKYYPIGFIDELLTDYPKNMSKFMGDKYIIIDKKPYPVRGNKKDLVDRIYWDMRYKQDFGSLEIPPYLLRQEESVLKNIIKKFLSIQ